MASVISVMITGVLLSLLVTESMQAPAMRPLDQLRPSQLTCLPKKGNRHGYWYNGQQWHCSSGSNPLTYTVLHPNIVHTLSLPHLNLTENSFKCYSVKTYDILLSGSSCPAFCKLSQTRKKHSCSESRDNNLLVSLMGGRVVLLKSPMYDCSSKYPKSVMCVYSVSMPCSSNSVVVSSHSKLNLSESDFVQVVDNNRSQGYQPVTGSTWPATQHAIPSSQLKVVFWSNDDNRQGKGFKLQLSCPSYDMNVTSAPETTQQESGDDMGLVQITG